MGGAVACMATRVARAAARSCAAHGVLYSLAEDDPESVMRRAAFEQAIKELGWVQRRKPSDRLSLGPE